jgi:hypothetical protein
MKRNLTPTDMFNQLVEDAFYSRTYGKVVVVRDDEKLWDVFTNVVVESELSDELISLLHSELLNEERLAILMSNIEVGAV